ncbi:hypothetical protein PCH70_13030 [Pseudomonas cichorii JBC1]|nr:hypothetical protein PCH70_13030 [Pseudomonas cichorii JBC1]
MTGAHGWPLSVAGTGNDPALYGGVPVAYRARLALSLRVVLLWRYEKTRQSSRAFSSSRDRPVITGPKSGSRRSGGTR